MKTLPLWLTYPNRIGLATILIKEVHRFVRNWTQTILPSVITMTLYFLIFGHIIGNRIGPMNNIPYVQFIAPGLIIMAIITNAYTNVVFSFFIIRFTKSVEEMLVSPMPDATILLGYTIAGILRGLLVATLLTVVARFFTHFAIHSIFITLTIAVLTATLFALAGFTNSLFARKFDDVAIIPTFVLTPLIYLGGVFYAINLLPEPWRIISIINPIFYIVDTFRYGILGISQVSVITSILTLLVLIVAMFTLNLRLMKKGVGIRT